MPVATILIAVLVGIVTVVGGVVTIVHPETLDFEHYLNAIKTLALGVGLLGVGRGIHAAGRESSPISTDAFPTTGPEANVPGGGPPTEAPAEPTV